MIEHQKNKYGWEFVFLGANINAVETAGRYGIGADRAVDYHADSVGTGLSYEAMSEAVTAFRADKTAPMAAFDAVKDDFEKREKIGKEE